MSYICLDVLINKHIRVNWLTGQTNKKTNLFVLGNNALFFPVKLGQIRNSQYFIYICTSHLHGTSVIESILKISGRLTPKMVHLHTICFLLFCTIHFFIKKLIWHSYKL